MWNSFGKIVHLNNSKHYFHSANIEFVSRNGDTRTISHLIFNKEKFVKYCPKYNRTWAAFLTLFTQYNIIYLTRFKKFHYFEWLQFEIINFYICAFGTRKTNQPENVSILLGSSLYWKIPPIEREHYFYHHPDDRCIVAVTKIKFLTIAIATCRAVVRNIFNWAKQVHDKTAKYFLNYRTGVKNELNYVTRVDVVCL